VREELKNKLEETLTICELHHQRMMFALENVEKYFPLENHVLSQLNPFEMALFDQLIYRFSKLQDSMGNRLFRQILEILEEDITALSFIDILNRLEKIHLLESAKDWIRLRQMRNTVSHEYPFLQETRIEELNLFPEEVRVLSGIWLRLKKYTVTQMEGL
jgi:hypothetical protein